MALEDPFPRRVGAAPLGGGDKEERGAEGQTHPHSFRGHGEFSWVVGVVDTENRATGTAPLWVAEKRDRLVPRFFENIQTPAILDATVLGRERRKSRVASRGKR
jgi:hypothetical protein